jgi:hypothetical protein
MRLQLERVALTLALVFSAATARADNSFIAKTQVYVDNDHTTVVSPLVAVKRETWRGATLGASDVADVVSSASVDVVSNATKRMTDLRSEVTGNLSQIIRDTTLTGAYIYSTEHDYTSHNLSLGVSQDLFQRNSTLAIGWALSTSDIGRVGDVAFHRSLLVNTASVSWTQVLTRATIAQASYSFTYDSGYEASPYRFVRVDDSPDNPAAFKVPETLPGERYRHAMVVGLNRHLGRDSSLQADYRLYLDSWGVTAHTVQIRYFVVFGGLTLRLRERVYYQTGADFYRAHYLKTELTPFVTADRELSTFWSNVAGVKASWRLPILQRMLSVEAKVDFFYFGYQNFPLLGSRVGADLEAGLSMIY